MDDDLDFSPSLKKKSNVKKGRRAKDTREPSPPPSYNDEEELNLSLKSKEDDLDELLDDLDGQREAPPKPARRVGGWGDETSAANKGRRRKPGEEEVNDFDDDRLKQTSTPDNDSDSDIPVIPDLEDTQEEDMTSQMAMAPNVQVNRVATYRELDNELLNHAAFASLDNEIDLKLLTKCLSSEHDVTEDDRPWEWDRLFTEVTSELITEWERASGQTADQAA